MNEFFVLNEFDSRDFCEYLSLILNRERLKFFKEILGKEFSFVVIIIFF